MWVTERATDYLRGDIPVKGGLTTMLKTAHLAGVLSHEPRRRHLVGLLEQRRQRLRRAGSAGSAAG